MSRSFMKATRDGCASVVQVIPSCPFFRYLFFVHASYCHVLSASVVMMSRRGTGGLYHNVITFNLYHRNGMKENGNNREMKQKLETLVTKNSPLSLLRSSV